MYSKHAFNRCSRVGINVRTLLYFLVVFLMDNGVSRFFVSLK